MKRFFKDNLLFILLFIIVYTGLGIVLLTYSKTDLHLWMNSFHNTFCDFFLRYYTHVAVYGILVTAFIFLFWRLGASLYLLVGEVIGGIVIQITKLIVKSPRPKVFFDLPNNPDAFPTVDGVNLHTSNSFPSGHASTFFILFFILVIVINYYGSLKTPMKWLLQVLCFLLALVGAYSRIYLSQHFTMDVFVGSIIGVLTVILLHPIFEWINRKYPKFCAWHIGKPKAS